MRLIFSLWLYLDRGIWSAELPAGSVAGDVPGRAAPVTGISRWLYGELIVFVPVFWSDQVHCTGDECRHLLFSMFLFCFVLFVFVSVFVFAMTKL